MKAKALLILGGILFLILNGITLPAAQEITASLSANPKSYSGKCPAVIKFKGKITVERAGKVQYKFIRSDGAFAPVETLVFDKPGSKAVSTTWTMGGPNLPQYSGWQAIEIVYPQSLQSNKAHFKIQCAAVGQGKPDLRVKLSAPSSAAAGSDIGSQIKVEVFNRGSGPAAGTSSAGQNGYMIDIMLSSDTRTPSGWATYSATYREDVLLQGGRISNTQDLAPGQSRGYRTGGGIPADTPPGSYYLCAKVDAGEKIAESNEGNNVFCKAIRITGRRGQAVPAKLPDLGMYGFLKIGKQNRQVKWNETIVLTPRDATLVSGGKPAFEVYYAYREYNGVDVPGPFKNKIFFNGRLVSQQTNLSLGPREIKNVHTQAYLGPQDGRLQVKIDADGEVSESREDNNFHFYVNLKFTGF